MPLPRPTGPRAETFTEALADGVALQAATQTGFGLHLVTFGLEIEPDGVGLYDIDVNLNNGTIGQAAGADAPAIMPTGVDATGPAQLGFLWAITLGGTVGLDVTITGDTGTVTGWLTTQALA